jgi:hypothetical protein
MTISHSSFSGFQRSAIFLSQVDTEQEYIKVKFTKPITTTESLTIRSCVFSKLHNYDGGGAIYCTSSFSRLHIYRTGFRDCRSSNNGGAILFDAHEVVLSQCCFDRCEAPEKGQAFHFTMQLGFDSDETSLRQCSMSRPCGESHASYTVSGVQRYRTSNFSYNIVETFGACVGSSRASTFLFHYGMVSHNSGTNLFWFDPGQELKVAHCSVLHNGLIGEGALFQIGGGVVHLEQSNFIENKFTWFAVKGKLSLDAKIVVDFDLTSRLFAKADIMNMENAFKVLWIDAGMAQMETWVCWALGQPSPSPSQSPPPIEGGDRRESGIATFLILSVVAGIPTVFGYLWWTRNENRGRDLSVLDPLVISNE